MAVEKMKEDAIGFLEKAEEFYNSALENYQKGRYAACIFDATQSIILANDAFCIFILGKRASKDHREAVLLHAQASQMRGESKKEIVSEALEKRSEFGYNEIKASEKEANKMLVKAKRFLDWVKVILK
jgi:HEPN domain-containing protein